MLSSMKYILLQVRIGDRNCRHSHHKNDMPVWKIRMPSNALQEASL